MRRMRATAACCTAACCKYLLYGGARPPNPQLGLATALSRHPGHSGDGATPLRNFTALLLPPERFDAAGGHPLNDSDYHCCAPPAHRCCGMFECSNTPMDEMPIRFMLVALAGTCVSAVGILNNMLAIHIFVNKLGFAANHMLYLVCLAAFDILLELSYIMAFSVDVFTDHVHIWWLYQLWHWYIPYVATVGQVSMTGAVFMMVAASAERYMTTSNWLQQLSVAHRCFVVTTVLVFAFVSKGTVLFEIEVYERQDCIGFGSLSIQPSNLARSPAYNYWIRLGYRHVACVFVPFFALLYLNAALLAAARRVRGFRGALMRIAVHVNMGENEMRERERRVRDATRMLVATVATYVFANTLNIVITAWEHVDVRSLRAAADGMFYPLASDVVSFLTMSCGAVRLPIYCLCNGMVRVAMRQLLIDNWSRLRCQPVYARCRACEFREKCICTPRSNAHAQPRQQNADASAANAKYARLQHTDIGRSRLDEHCLLKNGASPMLGAGDGSGLADGMTTSRSCDSHAPLGSRSSVNVRMVCRNGTCLKQLTHHPSTYGTTTHLIRPIGSVPSSAPVPSTNGDARPRHQRQAVAADAHGPESQHATDIDELPFLAEFQLTCVATL